MSFASFSSTPTIVRQSLAIREHSIHSSLVKTTTSNQTLTISSLQTTIPLSDIYDPRITKLFAIICLFVGSIGNLLSFIVFIQKRLRKRSTFRYLAYLSAVDFIVLYLGLGNIVLRDYFLYDIRTQNLFLCKLHTFLTYVTTQLSSWLLTIVSIDRTIACTNIRLNRQICRSKSADRIVLSICIIISLINSHILLFMGSKHSIMNQSLSHNTSLYKEFVLCTHNTSNIYFKFFEKPYSIIDLLSYVLIPLIVMTICSIAISYRLFSVRHKIVHERFQRRTHSGRRRTEQLSYMLLILNLVFAILLTPIAVGQIFQELNQEYRYRLYNSITLLMSYSNHALNFIFYGITAPPFRSTLKQLLGIENNYPVQVRSTRLGYTTTAL